MGLPGQHADQPAYSTRVAIRPESITLLPAGKGLDTVILGHSLLGNVIRYRVECRQFSIVVDVLNRSAADLFSIQMAGELVYS